MIDSARDFVLGVSPFETHSARLVAEVVRGGGVGIMDISRLTDRVELDRARSWSREAIGVRVGAGTTVTPECLLAGEGAPIDIILLAADAPWAIADLVDRYRVLVEVVDLDEARDALAARAYGVIIRGNEAGGRVSELSSFVALQQFAAADLGAPFWIAGGIGQHTAAAAAVAGAAGVVLDVQLALLPEAGLTSSLARRVRSADPAATVVIDGQRRLVRRRPGRAVLDDDGLAVGQDVFLARRFAQDHVGAAAAVRSVTESFRSALASSEVGAAFAPESPMARRLGTRLPVIQGPMTRVSDQAGFAATVAAHGALPMIALAAADAASSTRMLDTTRGALGASPWGAGVLGFLPPALQDAQFDAVVRAEPDWVLVAGGRPSHVKRFAAQGIRTMIHVPSPGLLEQFLAAGVTDVVFEGAECGGHIGPLNSFPLWEAQIGVLEKHLLGADAAELGVVFAGGIHDARSSAMVAALSASIRAAGVAVGVLVGTAYLFTEEAVRDGATVADFQETIRASTSTTVLESAPGHQTRCVPSPFTRGYREREHTLRSSGLADREVWERLEQLNVGRLRLAAKGIERVGADLRPVDESRRQDEGLFMAGQVAVLRDELTTVAELHNELTIGPRRLLEGRVRPEPEPVRRADPAPVDVAIVGMSCLFPDANGLADFWSNIFAGADAVTEVPDERWDTSLFFDNPSSGAPQSTSKWGAFLPRVAINPLKYGIPPASLASIDPVQLLALEVADRALADAGLDDKPFDRSRTAVIFGAESGSDLANATGFRSGLPTYLGHLPDEIDQELPDITADSFPGMLVNVISGRIANRLDLGGSNYVVDAACASSLAALDVACRELTSGSSDVAIAGGADLHNGIADYVMFSSVQALSANGRSRPFDAAADGIALGEGVACVVLKRAEDARRDGDRIYAVIKGIGSSSDGRSLGLTAPRVQGQRLALERAYAAAGVSPAAVGLVEAHGTGTVVGDRSELRALTEMFQAAGVEPGTCALGSVKSQIGHTKCAAGLAGLIKTAMSLYTGVLPPTLHVDVPNDGWDAATSPFTFRQAPEPWLQPAAERVAGVSAFGFGGTNFHVVVAAEPRQAPEPIAVQTWPAELFVMTGDGDASTRSQLRALLAEAEATPALSLARLARGQVERARSAGATAHIALVADSVAMLRDAVRALLDRDEAVPGVYRRDAAGSNGADAVAVLFPGQGSQRVGMLAELLAAFPATRETTAAGRTHRHTIFPGRSFDPIQAARREALLTETRSAQPALGIVNLAAWSLLERVGLRPESFAGHSYGELCALSAAGAYGQDALLRLSTARADAVAAAAGTEPGTMAAASAPAAAVQGAIADILARGRLVLANQNSPAQTIVSGPDPEVAEAVALLEAAGIATTPLRVSAAFHSPVIARARQLFAAADALHEVAPPRSTVWSNRTASPYGDDVADELTRQVVSPVRFVEQIEAMYAAGTRVFVECGPGTVLTRLVDAILADRPHHALALDAGGRGITGFLTLLARLAMIGIPLDTEWLYAGRGRDPEAPSRWYANGHFVSDAQGQPIPGGLRPGRRLLRLADSAPVVSPPASAPAASAPAPAALAPAAASLLLRPTATDPLIRLADTGPLFPAPVPTPTPTPTPTPAPAERRPDPRGRTATPMNIQTSALDDLVSRFFDTGREVLAGQERILGTLLGAPRPIEPRPTTLIEQPPTEPVRTEQPLAVQAPTEQPRAVQLEPLAWPAEHVRIADGDAAERIAFAAPSVGLGDVAAQPPSGAFRADSAPTSAAPPAESATAVPTVASVATTTEATAPLSAAEIELSVREAIANRTGYPIDMIAVELDLEADLSIDSIKRMEIAGELLAAARGLDHVVEADVEALSRARTVAAITQWLTGFLNGADPAPASRTTPAAAPATEPAAESASVREPAAKPSAGSEPLRYRTNARPLPAPPMRDGSIASVAVMADPSVFAAIRAAAPEGVEIETAESSDGADALLLVVDSDSALPGLFGSAGEAIQRVRPRRIVLAASAHGEAADGLRGFARTLDLEHASAVNFIAIDAATPSAEVLVRETLAVPEGPALAISSAERQASGVEASALGVLAQVGSGSAGKGEAEARAIGLDRESVVVFFGGGRGITAQIAETFAEAAGCRIELIGSTPVPEPESAATMAADSAPAVRAALVADGVTDLAEVERATRRILAQREITETIAALEARGSTVRYRSVDVRDAAAVAAAITGIAAEHGRIDGVVYGSGVNIDLLSSEMSQQQFDLVYRTKVDGARALLTALDTLPERPGFVVGFGSIAAVAGSRGQLPYSAANDALETMLTRWGAANGCRTVTIHWGPWSPSSTRGGMVSPELEREYLRRGLSLIDPVLGAMRVLEELAWGASGDTAVVYTPSGWFEQ